VLYAFYVPAAATLTIARAVAVAGSAVWNPLLDTQMHGQAGRCDMLPAALPEIKDYTPTLFHVYVYIILSYSRFYTLLHLIVIQSLKQLLKTQFANDHFGISLTNSIRFWRRYARKTICTFSFPASELNIWPYDLITPPFTGIPCSKIEWTKGRLRVRLTYSAGEMYPTMCVEWAGNHFSLSLA